MQGICGTCGNPAEATQENEGYSSCCNDRICYGDEAAEVARQAHCDHKHTRVQTNTGYGFDGIAKQYTEVVCASCYAYVGETS